MEADRIAETITHPNFNVSKPVIIHGGTPNNVSRQMNTRDEEEKLSMKSAGLTSSKSNYSSSAIQSGINMNLGKGSKLPGKTKAYFEPRFGKSLDHVRVHSDSHANRLSEAINARAFTKGKDIFFASGQFKPGSQQGKRLIAHELTHVIQQGSNGSVISRKGWFGKAWDWTKGATKDTVDWTKGAVKDTKEWAKPYKDAYSSVVDDWGGGKECAKNLYNTLNSTIDNNMKSIISDTQSISGDLEDTLLGDSNSSSKDSIAAYIGLMKLEKKESAGYKEIKNAVSAHHKGILDCVKSSTGNIKDTALSSGKSLWSDVKGLF